MSDITHSDYCPEDNGGELEDCQPCMAREREQMDYYRALFGNRPRYTADEIRDAYSHPTEYHKRESLLREIQ